MQLKEITIRNFRCFNKYRVTLAPRVTVLYGKNGAGKTTLIHAIHKALSFIMYTEIIRKKNPETKKRELVGVKTITGNNPYLRVEGYRKDGDFNNENDTMIEIGAVATMFGNNEELRWKMSAYTHNHRLRSSAFIHAFRIFYDLHKMTNELPVLAYYSDCFPHKEDQRRKSKKKKIAGLRNFGYHDWNAVEGCMDEWIGRLEASIREYERIERRLTLYQNTKELVSNEEMMKVEKEALVNLNNEIRAIESVLIKFSADLLPMSNTFYIAYIGIGMDDRLCLYMKSGEKVSFEQLPAGYRRLYNIVLDLAYRSYILNHSVDARGIAIIDEIDLHLHPELQQVVLNQLVATFPNVQFIVSTHSFLVLRNLPTLNGENAILYLHSGQEEPVKSYDIFGLDVDSGLQEVMGVKPSNEELKTWISRCAFMRKMGYDEQCENLKRMILDKNLISAENLEKRIIDHLNTLN